MRARGARALPGSRRRTRCADLSKTFNCFSSHPQSYPNTSATEPLVFLRYFGPEVNPDAPEMGAHNALAS